MRNYSTLWNKKIEYTLFAHLSKKSFRFAEERYSAWVLFIPESGCFQYEIEGLPNDTLSPGEILLCPPDVLFRKRVISPVSLYILHLNILPDEDLLPASDSRLYRKLKVRDEKRLFSTLAYLKSYYFRQGIETEYLTHLLNDVWYLLCLEQNRVGEEEPLYSENPEMRSIYEYLCLHLSEKINLGDIAEVFGYSDVNFIRRFKKLFSATPIAFLTALRLKKAERMLLETNDTVTKISKKCGFESPYYFSNVFSRHHGGISPVNFRSAHSTSGEKE